MTCICIALKNLKTSLTSPKFMPLPASARANILTGEQETPREIPHGVSRGRQFLLSHCVSLMYQQCNDIMDLDINFLVFLHRLSL